MGNSRRPPLRVQPYFGYRTTQRLVLSGRTLRSRPPHFDQQSTWKSIRLMLSQFIAKPVRGCRVTLCLTRPDGEEFEFVEVSDEAGYFRFDIPLEGDWPRPAQTAWEVVRIAGKNRKDTHSATGQVLVAGEDAQIGVISDIDDTIIETGITGGWHNVVRNWKRLFAQMPQDRIAVEGADAFYGAIGGGEARTDTERPTGSTIPATRRPFFYISSSPWGLFSYLVTFQQSRGLPLGPLFLRKWGFNRNTIGGKSHLNHKRHAIERILQEFNHLRFALIGDDTQGDLPAFAEAVARDPERIVAVFIRSTEKKLSASELEAKRSIESFGVPLWVGTSYVGGQDFLKAAGVAPDGETSRIVETVGKGPSQEA